MKQARYVHIFRRRREGKTDYRKRRGVVVSKRPFLSVRISGKYIYGQVLKPTAQGDITLCAVSSRDLTEKFGWKGSPKSIPGAYLTGYQLGNLAKQKGVEGAVVYTGVGRFVHGSRIASLIAGVKDAGLEMEIDEESLPDEKRMKGEHISSYARELEANDKDAFNKRFSGLISSGLNPSEYPSHFEKVKAIIESASKKTSAG
ncbi:MAG TPA: 50S ribosomal protein L18 [Nitrososphaerales archaeon]|nr:50S ribosomal protein L18 [Nitrososphaerales archaeon]